MATDSFASVVRNGLRGGLPERYCAAPTQLWRYWFDVHARSALQPGMNVLDVGAGRNASIPAEFRPEGVTYTGLDISRAELARAPEASYDETLTGDVCSFHPELAGRFDLVLSLFLLEHVASVSAALENARRYLVPGGRIVAQLAGGRSAHALINRAIPHRLARRVAHRAMRGSSYRAADSVFPAVYDHCTATHLRKMLMPWGSSEVVPQHTGVQYFLWSNWATALYLSFEEPVFRRGWDDLATWYLVIATKGDDEA